MLTGSLALVYYGSVVVLQNLFGSLTGESAPIIVVVSTLIIAALFNPLRRRVQAAIDRRFFRKKYEAQQVLAHFAQTARDEVSLEVLSAELVKIVRDAVQTTQITIWIKPKNQSQK